MEIVSQEVSIGSEKMPGYVAFGGGRPYPV